MPNLLFKDRVNLLTNSLRHFVDSLFQSLFGFPYDGVFTCDFCLEFVRDFLNQSLICLLREPCYKQIYHSIFTLIIFSCVIRQVVTLTLLPPESFATRWSRMFIPSHFSLAHGLLSLLPSWLYKTPPSRYDWPHSKCCVLLLPYRRVPPQLDHP